MLPEDKFHLREVSNYKITFYIDDVTSVYLQQGQGIGLAIHLNELLYYSMAHPRACVR